MLPVLFRTDSDRSLPRNTPLPRQDLSYHQGLTEEVEIRGGCERFHPKDNFQTKYYWLDPPRVADEDEAI